MRINLATIAVSFYIATVAFSPASATSALMYGYSQVDIPPASGVNLVGFNFTSDTTLYLEDVFGSNQLVQDAVPSNADQVHLWNGTGYDSYFQKSNGLFYDSTSPGGSPATTAIQSGTALFLQSPSGASVTNMITLFGAVAVTNSESQTYDSLITIANPYPTELDLNGTNVDWSAGTSAALPPSADKVYIWNSNKSGGAGYDVFYLYTDDKWHQVTGTFPYPLGNAVISPGGGAFYEAENVFSNSIVRPFAL